MNNKELKDIEEISSLVDRMIEEMKKTDQKGSENLKSDLYRKIDKQFLLEHLDQNQKKRGELHSQLLSEDVDVRARKLKLRLKQSPKIWKTWAWSSISAVAVICLVMVLMFQKKETRPEVITVSASLRHAYQSPTLVVDNDNEIVIADLHVDESTKEHYSLSKNKDLKFKRSEKDSIPKQNKLVVPSEHMQTVVLADGSEVVLNANSQIEFPSYFNDTIREVFLKGEAFFKIKSSKKPFIVRTDETYVRVYGTAFNVNARNQKRVETLLVEGKVAVGLIDSEKETALAVHQLAIIDTKTEETNIRQVDPSSYLSWKGGSFEVIDGKFTDLLADLANWYGVDFRYSANQFDHVRLTLSIQRSASLKETLEKIKMAINIQITTSKTNTYDIVLIR